MNITYKFGLELLVALGIKTSTNGRNVLFGRHGFEGRFKHHEDLALRYKEGKHSWSRRTNTTFQL